MFGYRYSLLWRGILFHRYACYSPSGTALSKVRSETFGRHCPSILPPSIETLRERLENRDQDSKEVIDARMKKAKAELKHHPMADFLVVNDDFEEALKGMKAIIRSNRLTTKKQQIINRRLLARLV